MERGDDGDDEDNDETEVTKDDVDDDDEMITTNVNDDGKYYRRASPGWHLSQPPRNATHHEQNMVSLALHSNRFGTRLKYRRGSL